MNFFYNHKGIDYNSQLDKMVLIFYLRILPLSLGVVFPLFTPKRRGISNITSVVKNKFRDVIQNFDSYAQVLEDNIKATMEEIGARKQLLKELNSSRIYYTSEQKDAKVVQTAYSMYGKKLNAVNQKLAEQMALFSSSNANNSLCSTENSTITTPYQDTSVSRRSSTVTSLIPLEPGASFLDKFLKEPTSDSSKSVKEKYAESGLENPHKQKFSKLAELYTEGKPGYDQMSTCPLREISKPSSYKKSILSPLYDMDTKSKNDFDQKIKIAKYHKTEEKVNFMHKDLNVLNKPVESSNLETKSILDEKRNVTKKIENISAIEDINEIDILLEESFDNKTSKLNISHGSFKKKIENLLKAKKHNLRSFQKKLNDAKTPLTNSIFGNTSYSEQNIPFLENATEETSQLFKNNKVGTSFIDSQRKTHDQTTDETQPITSSSVDSPNLMQAVGNFFLGLSNKQFTGCDTMELNLAPHMPLEAYLIIYKALLARPEFARLATLPNAAQELISYLSNVKQEKGFTPLDVKQEKGFTPLDVKQEKGFTPLVVKQEKGFTPLVVKQEKGFTPLVVKQEKGFTPLVVKQEKGFTPLVVKQEKGFTPLVVKQKGVLPISVKQERGFTPLAVKQEGVFTPLAVKQERGFTPLAVKQERGFTPLAVKQEGQSSIQLKGISSPPITVSSYIQPKKLSYATCVQQILNRSGGTVWKPSSASSSTSITDDTEDNFEVLDMECDSDEE
ncbi:hypothetical protein CEXT_234623 [Caerostris extrusa]|uniref:Uncharacterized protein n=1 Tax=Caerostris extrusa TaxID=172846 RepID=A0AAV4M6T8_CAEEX|nr:hypothetical protein CEXT_234623 [Caerostris extrusa]